MNGTPIPSSTPLSSIDSQQLQLIHQIQSHAFSNGQMGLLSIIMFLPLPIALRLAVYNLFSASPLAHLSPIVAVFVVTCGPILSLLFIYFATKFLLSFAKTVIPFALKHIRDKPEEKKLLELTFPSDTSKSAYATEQLFALLHTLARRKTGFFGSLIGEKRQYSLEIVASKNEGIRYVLAADTKDADILKRSLLSYLPGIKIKEVSDYLSLKGDLSLGVVELKLSSHFALPLAKQNVLSEHDPIAYLTGHMTGLKSDELVSFQVITTPVLSSVHNKVISEIRALKHLMYKSEPLSPYLQKSALAEISQIPVISVLVLLLKATAKVFSFSVMFTYSMVIGAIDTSGKSVPFLQPSTTQLNMQQILNPYEQELKDVVKEKIDQHLFETTVRVLVMGKDAEDLEMRMQGIIASFGPMSSAHQALTSKSSLGRSPQRRRLDQFITRSLSIDTAFNQNPILSTSEISDIFHFPYTNTTKTESLIKSKSKDLPAPLSQKKSTTTLDVVVGKNSYGNQEQTIGLTTTDRKQHTYIVGKTGSGKTTIIKSMALQDIASGKGVCVIDPHGDMVQELLALIPEHRRKDVVYLNPADKKFPMGLNILAPDISFEDEDEAQERISRSLMSVFMKITPKEHWGQRMEHILRNATLTTLQIKTPSAQTPYISLLAIQKLLTDKKYQKEVVSTLTDPVLKQFWDKEFKAYGNMQRADITGPLTNKLGEFITDKMSRHILLQKQSTVNVQQIMDEGKILLVNLSKGQLGEERSAFFGTLIISLIQLAIYNRAQMPPHLRRDFFVYIDEFQNFATDHFVDIFSESRKFCVYFIPSHQNIAQIDDPKTAKVVLSNSGNFIVLKNGPDDERVLLPFLESEVEKGEIINLAPHHFYMKVANEASEDAFSGETILVDTEGNDMVAKEIIKESRKNYATPLAEVEMQLGKLFESREKTSKVNRPTKPSIKKQDKAPKKQGI